MSHGSEIVFENPENGGVKCQIPFQQNVFFYSWFHFIKNYIMFLIETTEASS